MPMKRPLPVLRPERIRCPPTSFAWLDHRLRSDGWLQRLTSLQINLYLFLALAADARGLSCWRLDRVERELPDANIADLRAARARLVTEDLIAFKPWSSGHLDGCYQLLSVPHHPVLPARPSAPESLGACLPQLKELFGSDTR